MADIASSRIFVKGLPPTFTETEFKKHFSQNREVTDAKIFPNRRIGYVGYKTPEGAQSAVKYFNKTFIRMSRIGVELARPVQDAKNGRANGVAPTARRASDDGKQTEELSGVKRKRESEAKQEDDPKLKEFLDAYKPKSRKKAWEAEGIEAPAENAATTEEGVSHAVPEAQSDHEYEAVPKKVKRAKRDEGPPAAVEPQSQEASDTLEDGARKESEMEVDSEAAAVHIDAENKPTVSDADWARSRTSRLLGLLDDDEEEAMTSKPQRDVESDKSEDELDAYPQQTIEPEKAEDAANSMPTPPSDDHQPTTKPSTSDADAVRLSMRLFVRNLPYDVQRDELQAEFANFGNLEEVCVLEIPFHHVQ